VGDVRMSRRQRGRQALVREFAEEWAREQRAERERVRAEASRVERARLRLFEESTWQVWRTLGFVVLGLLMIVSAPWLLSLIVR
jgi:hypothetical protein